MAGGETPVSWFLIEPGWEVVDAEGEHVGRVEETTGDSTHDIFDGLSIAPGVFRASRYVPSEQVAEITEGRVRLKLSKDEIEHLGGYEEPPTTARIEQEQAPVQARPGGWWLRVIVRLRALLRLPQG